MDATDLNRRIFYVRQSLPVKPGPLTLLFPRRMPGTHGPKVAVEKILRSKYLK